jgi:phosphoribosylamine--glycine ligase
MISQQGFVAGPGTVLVLGGGGREHAIAWSLAREASVTSVLVAPGSDAIATEPKVRCFGNVSALDGPAVLELATSENVDLVVVGPEAVLAAGVVDVLMDAGVPVFGPTQAAARIESSKAFCREVAQAAGVRMARGREFRELAPALAYARELVEAPGSCGVVIKADGLMAGKGVTVCNDFEEAEAALKGLGGPAAVEPGTAAGTVATAPFAVVEERLEGLEASLIALCDDHDALALPPARDHKRLLDGDAGPNTGGMGAYSPVPDLPDSLCATLLDLIHKPVLAEMARRGLPFRGALYAGLMLTPEGPVLLEFNARFGDPEIQAILPRMVVPLSPLLLAAAQGNLAGTAASLGIHERLLPTTGDAAVAVVLAAAGYPESPRKGDPIHGLEEAVAAGATVFHAGTKRAASGGFETRGGRVLAVVALGSGIAAARANAERAADLVTWEGMQRRHDIAAKLPGAAASAGTGPGASPITAADWDVEAPKPTRGAGS